MSSRHPVTLIELMRTRQGRTGEAALLEDRPTVVGGTNQGQSVSDTIAGLTPNETGDGLVTGAGPTFAPAWAPQYAEVEIVLTAGGPLIQPGIYMDIVLPFACVIVGWAMYTDQVATARIDLWSDVHANFPPTIAGTMPGAAANRPQVAAANKATGAVAGWTKTAFLAGDILRVNLDVNDVATRITLGLKVRKT